MQQPGAMRFFNVPVDPDALGIPEYRDIIKEPLDLGTISETLVAGGYPDPPAVKAAVAKVWANCRAFNGEDSPVTAAATMILVDDGVIGLDDPVVRLLLLYAHTYIFR